MQVEKGVVRDGKIELSRESSFPEGAVVTIYFFEEPIELDPEEEAELQKGIEQADRGELHDWEDIVAGIRRR